jgi:RNA polymerase sigma-70 factor (sigma-E family)
VGRPARNDHTSAVNLVPTVGVSLGVLVMTDPVVAIHRDRDDGLRELFESQYPSLVRLACLLLDDRGLGEEIVQDAFVKVHGSWERIADPAAAPAYLRSAVMNAARSRMRHRLVARKHEPAALPPTDSAEAHAILREDQAEVLAALRALPNRQRECLALRYYLELSEAEIATTLGISAGSVKTHTHRGMTALAQKLEHLR